MYDLKLTDERSGPVTIVTAEGPVDVYTCPMFREYLLSLIAQGNYLIAVDASQCDYLDSTGLGVLVQALKKVRQRGGHLDVICTDERTLNVFRVTGLTKVFGIHASKDEAVAALAELAGAVQ